jgi:coatomer subunit beta'
MKIILVKLSDLVVIVRQERVMAWQATTKPGMVYRSPHFSDRSAICSAKFIAQNQWFAVGDGHGCIYVYAYTTKYWVHIFEAHRAASVSLFAVHPTFPFLL